MKYYLPESKSFWIGVLLIVSGILGFVDALYPLGPIKTLIGAAYGEMPPFVLILWGSGTITLRRAMK
jgi:hypothetical protein